MDSSPTRVSFDGAALRLDTAEDAEEIVKELRDKEVEILVLQGNTFGIEAAEHVGLELSNQSKLREAHFKDLFTSRGREEVPVAMRHLLKGIEDSGAQLTLLDLSDNAIGPIGAPALIEFLQSSSANTLEILYLNNCGMGPEGSTSIAAYISRLKNLRVLVCGRNRLENKGATNVSIALSELDKLEILKVNQNGIHIDGIKNLVKALKVNKKTITEIDMSDNTIKAEGADAIGQVLVQIPNLKSIRLDDCILTNEGFSIICDALSKSPSLANLKEATFEGNELHGSKIIDLIELTFNNCTEDFQLNLLENEFNNSELLRLEALKDKIEIIVDDIDESDAEHDNPSEDSNQSGDEEGTENAESDNEEASDGFVDLSNFETEVREVCQDFIEATKISPSDEGKLNSAFIQMISTGFKPMNSEYNLQATQILCEELGLMKCEQTRRRKSLPRDAIKYVNSRSNELPTTFKNFFEVIIKNFSDEAFIF